MAKPQIATGTYEGTGAAINIELGFIPERIEIVQWTDGDKRFLYAEENTFVHTGGTNATAPLASNGISTFDGEAGETGAGFTAGTECSADGKVYAYTAMRAN